MEKFPKIRVVLYEPEIPQNTGSILRTCSCFDIPLSLIRPFGFVLTDKAFRRAKLDYSVELEILDSKEDFFAKYKTNRKILLTPHSENTLEEMKFLPGDILFFGRESNGVEKEIAAKMDYLISIPMSNRCRSLNLAASVAIVACKGFQV